MKPPDTVLIALTFADDTVGIMAFVTTEYHGGVPQWSRPASRVQVEKEIAKASASFDPEKRPVKAWRFVARQDVPRDRTYRNALRDDGKTLTHDMAHAREIHRNHLREARAPKLAALDVEYQRADEQNDKTEKTRIAAAKQALRDLPALPAIDAAQTVDDLKTVWPDDFLT